MTKYTIHPPPSLTKSASVLPFSPDCRDLTETLWGPYGDLIGMQRGGKLYKTDRRPGTTFGCLFHLNQSTHQDMHAESVSRPKIELIANVLAVAFGKQVLLFR